MPRAYPSVKKFVHLQKVDFFRLSLSEKKIEFGIKHYYSSLLSQTMVALCVGLDPDWGLTKTLKNVVSLHSPSIWHSEIKVTGSINQDITYSW